MPQHHSPPLPRPLLPVFLRLALPCRGIPVRLTAPTNSAEEHRPAKSWPHASICLRGIGDGGDTSLARHQLRLRIEGTETLEDVLEYLLGLLFPAPTLVHLAMTPQTAYSSKRTSPPPSPRPASCFPSTRRRGCSPALSPHSAPCSLSVPISQRTLSSERGIP